MKLHTQKQVVKRSKDFEASSFSIKASAHAFKILSDGMYSNKIRAAIREICCNAWDAHISAGTTDKEFVVTLPNTMNSIFKVRDYGIGLSHEDVMHLYTTYFESNKTDSDDETGGFGLGSKSPFAYTDNFDVVSYFEGEKRTYSALISESGAPTINLLLTEDTDEHNGLEVSFPVNSDDIENFKREAEYALKPFKKRPKIVGRQDLDFTEDGEEMLSGTGWAVYKTRNSYYNNSSPSIVRMGNVDYPFPIGNISPENSSFLTTFRVVIEVPVGFVDPTPSRETLSMTKQGEVALDGKIKEIIEEMVKEAKDEVAKCKGIWEARILLRNLTSYNGQFRYLKDSIPWTWRGQEVLNAISFNGDSWKKNRDGISVKEYNRANTRNGKTKVTLEERGYSYSPGENDIYLLDDYNKNPDYKVRNYIRHYGDDNKTYVMLQAKTKAALKQFLKEVGKSQKDLTTVTSLPLPPKSTTARAPRKAKGYETAFSLTKGGSWYDKSGWWARETVDFAAGGYFVPIKRWQGRSATGYDYSEHPKEVLAMLNRVRDIIDIPKLYGIKEAASKKFKDDAKWINVYDALKDKLETLIKDPDLIAFWNFENGHGEELDSGDRYSRKAVVLKNLRQFYKNNGTELDSAGVYSTVMEYIEKALSTVNKTKLEQVHNLQAYVSAEIDHKLAKVDVFKEAGAIFKEYPMLKIIESDTLGTTQKDKSALLVGYINTIDNG